MADPSNTHAKILLEKNKANRKSETTKLKTSNRCILRDSLQTRMQISNKMPPKYPQSNLYSEHKVMLEDRGIKS